MSISKVRAAGAKDLEQLLSSPTMKGRKRQLSPHVMTRIYRAPEVMLIEREYDQAVDIWSLGAVLGELMSCSKPYMRPFKHLPRKERSDCIKQVVDNRHLFLGDSCFPLSPRHCGNSSEAESLIS